MIFAFIVLCVLLGSFITLTPGFLTGFYEKTTGPVKIRWF